MKQLFLSGSFWAIGAVRVFAKDENPPRTGGLTITNPLGDSTFPAVVAAVSEALAQIAIPIVAVMVLYGAFQIMTAGGKPEQVSSGRKTILYAVIGYAVVLLATSVVPLLTEILGGGSGSEGTTQADQ
ncbi:MAG: hypothetical protein AAB759_02855 [Patescibacteria group bacterium]